MDWRRSCDRGPMWLVARAVNMVEKTGVVHLLSTGPFLLSDVVCVGCAASLSFLYLVAPLRRARVQSTKVGHGEDPSCWRDGGVTHTRT